MRRKLTALFTLMVVGISTFAPTLAMAAPKHQHPSSRVEHRRVNHPNVQHRSRPEVRRGEHRGPRYEVYRNERRVPKHEIRRGEHRRPHYEHRRPHYERRDYHRRPRFEHRGRHYYHGYYRGFYRGYWRTWHSDDWIRAIGLAAFVNLIIDNRANFIDNYDYIYDRYGNVVAVIER